MGEYYKTVAEDRRKVYQEDIRAFQDEVDKKIQNIIFYYSEQKESLKDLQLEIDQLCSGLQQELSAIIFRPEF